MEIVEILELELNDSTGKIFNMNDINAAYINLLEENCVKNLRSDHKKHLTNLIKENIPNVHFNRPDDRTKPMQVLSLQTKEKVISKAAASPKLVEKDSLAIIMKASQVIRKDILEHTNSWQFSAKILRLRASTFDIYSMQTYNSRNTKNRNQETKRFVG